MTSYTLVFETNAGLDCEPTVLREFPSVGLAWAWARADAQEAHLETRGSRWEMAPIDRVPVYNNRAEVPRDVADVFFAPPPAIAPGHLAWVSFRGSDRLYLFGGSAAEWGAHLEEHGATFAEDNLPTPE